MTGDCGIMIEKKIINVLQEFANNKKIIVDPQSPLINIVESSIEFIELVVLLEDNFKFEFDDEKLLFDTYKTIGDLIQYVAVKMGESNEY